MGSTNNVTVRKFPVTAPDGTEYRVKIDEMYNIYLGKYTEVALYLPRKRFGFRRVFSEDYSNGEGIYDASNPDFIKMAEEVFRGYYAHIEWLAELDRKHAESILRKQSALDRFAEWDGKITED